MPGSYARFLGRSCWALLLAAGCSGGGARSAVTPRPPTRATAPLPASASVCRFGGSEALPAADANGRVRVPGNHPLVAYAGRVDCQASGGPMLGFVGASVRLRFKGTAVSLRLKDFGRETPQSTNYYDVSLDGAVPTLLEVSPANELYSLASGLPDAEHQLEIFKRVEASPGGNAGAGRAQVLGFELSGSALLPVSPPTRRIEVIGDSITCGYGDEVSTEDPSNARYTTRASNGHRAYGALTAALLGAQYSAVAYSGRGVSRNYAGMAGPLLPDLYLSSVPDDASASAWDPRQYTPDAVIINLGTNDFSTPGVDGAAFVQKYEQFLARLRGYYPRAVLLAALGPMLSDYYPPGAQAWTNARAGVNAAVAARVQAGDHDVHVLFFEPQTPPYGEDWHPTVATHEKMAQVLRAKLEELLGW
ncbi:MAG TPA: SGNH/GDSL hydrolase family protein [Polyangiaceae bacterium]|nr:SGNH/GDSL hydrolase family protein [Polyangiaceae bacterium]